MTPQQLQQLRQQYEQARAHVVTMQSRNVDAETLHAAATEAVNLKRRLDNAQNDVNLLAELDRVTGGMSSSSTQRRGRSLGAQIINSDLGQWLIKNKGQFPSGSWQSPMSSEIPGFDLHATTLDESSGSGGQVVVSDYRPGILPLLTRPLVVADLLAPGTTTSNSITYMVESTFTNAAAAVAESGPKPESTLVFTQTTENVRKIAHWIPVTDEVLQDVPQMQSYIDSRLQLGVRLAEDDALLNGNGTPPALTGLLNRSGLAATVARGTDTNSDAIAKQISAISINANLQPDGIIMHPSNYLVVQLAKTADGAYYSDGGPFARMQTPATLWGLPVALTTAIAAGTALVGAFQPATQIFRNGGLRVEASNSHASFFTTNLIAIRAEERLALAVYRASAIGKVTGLA